MTLPVNIDHSVRLSATDHSAQGTKYDKSSVPNCILLNKVMKAALRRVWDASHGPC